VNWKDATPAEKKRLDRWLGDYERINRELWRREGKQMTRSAYDRRARTLEADLRWIGSAVKWRVRRSRDFGALPDRLIVDATVRVRGRKVEATQIVAMRVLDEHSMNDVCRGIREAVAERLGAALIAPAPDVT